MATLVTVEHRSDWFTHRVMVEKPTSIAPASSIPADPGRNGGADNTVEHAG
ncbi:MULTISPECIES: hypothetical protein [Citrobacter]|uniref:hypothetical protein n=1 Tax=Citrobacter TaxID=544 RepID=UPI0019066C5F|nr:MULTISPECIES: hypothetical protein [Citrobacter]MBU5639743.1 hypothetical protein [Citrobacter sp. S46_ASV_140]EGT0619093.1 hypothetical protein [Citrobacter braakii]EGT0643539.1 hypothetical protein [Citrobacter braakii]ELN2652676.1 hypothetical protein [Citrobacter braakii]MBJ8847466.1 hypothetical protein [Citrobacter braakii]